MFVKDYIVKILIDNGGRETRGLHAFGIPGGVILPLLHSMKLQTPHILPHLTYNEQTAGFCACGYAQASGKLGIAYAIRGPGIMNMLTSIGEAYQESLPVLFMTAHGDRKTSDKRFSENQEINLVPFLSDITKFSANIDSLEDLKKVDYAYKIAMQGRKGPVFLDFSSKLFNQEVIFEENNTREIETKDDIKSAKKYIYSKLQKAKKPVILIGDGLRNIDCYSLFKDLKIPFISSRGSQDLISNSPYYFGYIGSHGIRYSNFILSKADLIISIGNRLAFPINSKSFRPLFDNKFVIQLDIDEKEIKKEIPNIKYFNIDAKNIDLKWECDKNWLDVCNNLKKELFNCDTTIFVSELEKVIKRYEENTLFVCDIGNNEFWFSRAFEKVRPNCNVLYSKSFGTLGVAIARAIGAYYATGKHIVCVIGDQGFQYNIQELQYLSQWQLPITIILVNNFRSGMILDHERKLFAKELLHVTKESGYSTPNFEKIANAYEIKYIKDIEQLKTKIENPELYEIKIDEDIKLIPYLPKGNLCQNLEPKLENYHEF